MAEKTVTKLVTFHAQESGAGNRRHTLTVCMDSDGFIFTRFSDGTMEAGAPALSVKRGSYLSYTYHPSETVYTGVTVGGVHTGGFHQTEASYSERRTASDRGYIQLSARCSRYILTKATVPQDIQNRFRRDREFQALTPNGHIACMDESNAEGAGIRSMLTGREDAATVMQMLSVAHDHRHLRYDQCIRIVNLLKRLCKADFPPTADVLYAQADKLAKAEDSRSLAQAMEDFRSLGNYRDAPARAAALKGPLAEAKEREDHQADRNRDKGKRILILAVAVGIVLVMVAAVLSGI